MEAPRLPGIGEQNGQRAEHAIRQIAQQLKNDYAPLVDPVFTGNPQAPTPAADDNSTSIATTAYVQTELADYATSDDLTDAIAQEVSDRDAAIAAAAYTPAAVADGTIQSNISGSSAAPAANSISAVLDDLLGTTRGSVAYRNATVWTALSPGTAGQYLETNGAGADPAWSDVITGPVLLASGSLTGASVAITGLATTYSQLRILMKGASHNSAGAAYLIATSDNNGSSYSSTAAISATHVAADVVDILAEFTNSNAASMRKLGRSLATNGSGGSSTFSTPFTATTGAIDAIRLSLSGGSFDAGTYEVYGVP